MKGINPISDLLIEELANLLNAENQLVEALPKMREASQSLALKASLENNLEFSKEHARRLQDIFNSIWQDPYEVICEAIKKLVAESEDVINKTERSLNRDAAILNLGIRVEQYEISMYQSAREHAADLGYIRIVELLTEILNEKRTKSFHLSELAQGMIIVQACEGFYIQEDSDKDNG